MASDDGNMACCGQRNASDGDMPIAMAKPKADDGAFISPPLRLTRKNLARLNTLNGDAKHNNNDNDNDSAYLFEDDSDTMTISTTASDFERRAYENGSGGGDRHRVAVVLDPVASHPPPQDLGIIRHHLTQRRTSTQPSEHAHQRYCKGISKSYNEAGVSSLVQSKIMKDYSESDVNYGRAHGRAITRIPSQDFNHGLSNPLPDILEGLDTEVLPDCLYDNHALHAKDSLSFCHFATEFKRTNGNLHQAICQAAYDGAVLANARDRALVQAATLSGNNRDALKQAVAETAVFTCATDGKVAEVFSHRFQNGQYYQNLVARESLLDYPNRGRELIRNTQDYARSKSYELAGMLGADSEEDEEVVVEAKGWGSF